MVESRVTLIDPQKVSVVVSLPKTQDLLVITASQALKIYIKSVFFVLFLWGCDDTSHTPTPTNNGTNNPTNNNPNNTQDPCSPNPCGEDRHCSVVGGQAQCGCSPGTHDEGGVCVEDEFCLETTCSSRGTCDDENGVRCDCEPEYSGDFCESCAEGFFRGPDGACTNDLCASVSCNPDQICVVNSTDAVCECPPGMHEDGGPCVPDLECGPNSCSGNGTCDDSLGMVSCDCDEGFATPNCLNCDATTGYHPNGAGGCTTDPCLPNPCSESNRSVCSSSGTNYECACDPGYHPEGPDCVIDQECVPSSCNAKGTCDDASGQIVCTCEVGYQGTTCADCDAAAGYHPDGSGGCTNDPCLPNPCTGANKTSCQSSGSNYVCQCDIGYHPDGIGGCTNDPCLPDLCAAQNLACRVVGNSPECYTPDCDDQNPCTTDTLVNGVCQHTALANGSACSTGVCTVGQTCQAGQCAGGAPRNCDDQNPCTNDSCSAAAGGCVNTPNDTIVPSDGVACTIDACVNGIASHTPSNSACDDGLWCTGTGVCQPSNSASNAEGCIFTNAPVAPANPSPCQTYGACDNATQSFVLIDRPAGSACNDGVACTSNDTCSSDGQCRGTLNASCDFPVDINACSTTTPFGAIDIHTSTIDFVVTMDGQDPEVSVPYYDFSIYAYSRATETYHQLAYFNPSYSTNKLIETIHTLPGVYDIHYRAGSGPFFHRNSAADTAPRGHVVLDRDVVFYAGHNQYSVDVKTLDVNLTITLNGQDPEVSVPYYDFSIYARDKETDTYQQLAYFNPSYSTNKLIETHRVLPGTYDIHYRAGSGPFYHRNSAADTAPRGHRILAKDVVFGPGSATHTFDIPVIDVNVVVTMDGQDPEVSVPYYDFSVYARAKDTGDYHQLAYFNPSYSTNKLIETQWLIPGTYDVYYRAGSGPFYHRNSAADTAPRGFKRILQDLVVDAANKNIVVDIATQPVTVQVTMDGQDPVTAQRYYDFSIYAHDRHADSYQQLAYYNPSYSTNKLVTTTRVLPGTFDIYYRAGSGPFYHRNSAADTAPRGFRKVQSNLTIGPANSNLSIDVDTVGIQVNITMDGQDPRVSLPYYDFSIYAHDQETDTFQQLAYYNPSYSTNKLVTSQWALAGTYDIYYIAGSGPFYHRNSVGDTAPRGRKLIASSVVISDTSTAVSVDVPVTEVSPVILMNGQDPEVSVPYYDFSVYALGIDSGTYQQVAYFNPSYSNNKLIETHRLLPGVYHLLYSAGSGPYYHRNSIADTAPRGRSMLDACVEVP